MSKLFGFELLAQQAGEAVEADLLASAAGIQSMPPGYGVGDTPIERLLFFAVWGRAKFGSDLEAWRVETCDAEKVAILKAKQDTQGLLLLERQVQLEGVGRVDFVFHAYAQWIQNPDGGAIGWRRLVVECDGHDFHERTKEQAAKDRSRDRAAALAGFEVFRFTGSELWRDPWGCAGQIIEWAERGI